MFGTCLGLLCLVLAGISIKLIWDEYQGVRSMAPGQIYRWDSDTPFHSNTIMIDEVKGIWCSYHYLTVDSVPMRLSLPGECSQKKTVIYRMFTEVK